MKELAIVLATVAALIASAAGLAAWDRTGIPARARAHLHLE